MIIGYRLISETNSSTLFGHLIPDEYRCKKCGYLRDFGLVEHFYDPNFKLRRKKYDMSYTHELTDIVSEKFRIFCEKNNYHGISFLPLPNDNGFYILKVNNIVEVDTQNIKFDNYCSSCKNYESVVMPDLKLFLKDQSAPLPDGLYATDLLIAGGDSKSRLVIFGMETYQKFQEENITGAYFREVYA